jgi:sigma-54 specific flagellar transcriptional regulator A
LDAIPSIIGQSAATLSLKQLIQRVAPSDATALIIGESGTGKELVARALYDRSPRAKTGQFVPVNCGAIPRELIESELFGHKKGSFTGAISDRKGRFEHALSR